MAPAPTPKPGAGKPGGLPIWAWGAAAALGLVLGLVFFRKAPATAADSSAAPAPAADESSSGAGGAVIALPPELLAALGLRGGDFGGVNEQGGSEPTGGAQAGSEQAGVFNSSAGDPGGTSISSGSYDAYRAQGTNQQLPARLQIPGLAPDAPVISSYFSQPQTISSRSSPAPLATVRQLAPPDLRGAGTRSFQPL